VAAKLWFGKMWLEPSTPSVLQSKQATLCQHFGDALDLVMPKIW
jgi:hypothetical protein